LVQRRHHALQRDLVLARIADVNGYCPKSPEDDLHHPEI